MSLFTATEVADLAATFLTDTCTIRRATIVTTPGGGRTQTWVNVATGVPCKLQSAGAVGTEAGALGRIVSTADAVLYVAATTDLLRTDRVALARIPGEFEVRKVLLGTDAAFLPAELVLVTS